MIAPATFRRTVAVALRLIQRHARDERGSTLVETALSILMLMTFIFAVLEACLGAYTFHFISEASREATRYAIVRGSSFSTDCAAPTSATCTAQGGNNTGDIATYVQNLNYPGINPSNMTVKSTWLKSDGTACGTTDSCKIPGNYVQVTIQYQFPLSIPFVSINSWTMKSTSQMVISQ